MLCLLQTSNSIARQLRANKDNISRTAISALVPVVIGKMDAKEAIHMIRAGMQRLYEGSYLANAQL